MDFDKIKKIIKKYHWWSEDCPGRWQYCYWINSAVEQKKYFHPRYLSACFVVFKNGYLYEKTSEEEKIKIYYWLKNKFRQDPNYIKKEHVKWLAVRKKLFVQIDIVIREAAQWDKMKLLQNYNKLLAIATDSVCWGFFLECIDPYNVNILPNKVAHELLQSDSAERNDVMIELSTPPVISFMEQYRVDSARLVFKYRKLLNSHRFYQAKDFSNFVNKYSCLSVNYGGSDPFVVKDFIKQFKELAAEYSDVQLRKEIGLIVRKPQKIRQQQKILYRKYDFSRDLADDFIIMRQIGAWIDERKESMVKTSLAVWTILNHIAHLTGASKNQLEFFTEKEINFLLKQNKKVSSTIIKERSKNSVFMVTARRGKKADLKIFTKQPATVLSNLLNHIESKELVGMVASGRSGIFRGRAQIIIDATKDKFQPGSILVTSMTRPDFVPIIKKASAIVTDEGGITCHAAIIARELGIPCVIGTRHATKLIKNGDRLEIDLASGKIKIM